MVDRWSSLFAAINSEEMDDAEVDKLGDEHNALADGHLQVPGRVGG